LGYVILRARFAPLLRSAARLAAEGAQGWIVLDSAGNVLHVNRAAAHILGIEGRTWRYRPYTALFAARTFSEEAREALAYAIAIRPVPYEAEIAMDSETDPVIVRVHVDPIDDATARTIGKTICLTEVTALRICQGRLRRTQRARAELGARLNTMWGPAIDLGDGNLVLPIADELDPSRARQLVTGLLDTARAHRARVVLLDLHAVPVLSPDAAATLLRGIEAADLLGAQIGLVGLQPSVARVLADLAIPIEQLRVYPDLPAALARLALL
jgi:PAS domain S-box-containing protein